MSLETNLPFLFIIPLLLVLFATVFVTNKVIKLEISSVKYPEIDGVRGYLAFFVFLHHSYIWNYFLKTNIWQEPDSNLFNHFGQTSVVFFFIITAFLFVTKLMETRNKPFDWNRYIISRFYRMFPMYILSVLAVFLMVAIFTKFILQSSFLELIKNSGSWLFFSINGTKDINNFEDTFLMNAGVTWTLPYEWMFYFLLPFVALLFKIKVPTKILLLFGLGFLVFAVINQASIRHFLPFLGGGLVVYYIQRNKLAIDFTKSKFTLLAIILLIIAVVFFHSGRKPIPVLISSLLFLFIAKGNSFFGLFSNTLSRKFGQITYSLYLIHGIVLFIIFYGIIGLENAKNLTQMEYWSIIALSIVPIIIISQLTYLYVEKPFMNILKK
ncbi:acyltransferase [Flavobacterium antarcticum]|uniref:acyltransferase family protein n=1 Tax=Flavobacterium antarcticum TaxID=271155 RepID=UPI0003B7443E|nr:acyltransferase [Flavobacterium antarcticum]